MANGVACVPAATVIAVAARTGRLGWRGRGETFRSLYAIVFVGLADDGGSSFDLGHDEHLAADALGAYGALALRHWTTIGTFGLVVHVSHARNGIVSLCLRFEVELEVNVQRLLDYGVFSDKSSWDGAFRDKSDYTLHA